MIKFRFAEIVNEDGSVRRIRYPVANKYRECLKENLERLADSLKDFPDEPSHLNYYSAQLNRHLRHGEWPNSYLPRSVTDDIRDIKCGYLTDWICPEPFIRSSRLGTVTWYLLLLQPRIRLTPYLRWRLPELRGGKHLTSCACMKRNGMQIWCPRWGCRGNFRCTARGARVRGAALGVCDQDQADQGCPGEPSCCESWDQRAKEADMQLYLMKKAVIVPRGLY